MSRRLVQALLALGAAHACIARELDPAACAVRFDVQRDKIIRTEESREMGARYLSELDVPERQECRRLCCETDSCDVFVYEEKSPGSCYLFNCGPPEDFRCKFTTHSNFSSGVLALSRRLAELQDQERLTLDRPPRPLAAAPGEAHSGHSSARQLEATARQHEASVRQHEASARQLEASARQHEASARSPPPPPPPPQDTPAPIPSPAPSPQTRRCSRYQFECHSSGECIAVYNACDGVPQCADGSDEAPELGCPAQVVPAVVVAAPPPAPPVAPPPAPPPTPPPAPPAAPPAPPQPRNQPERTMPTFPLEGAGGASLEEELHQELEPAAAEAGGATHWPSRLVAAAARPAPRLAPHFAPRPAAYSAPAAPHIFSHTGGLVRGSGAGGGEASWRHSWPDAARPPDPWGWPPQPQSAPRWPIEQEVMGAYLPPAGETEGGGEMPLLFPPQPQPQPALHDAPKKGQSLSAPGRGSEPALPPPGPPAPLAPPAPPTPPAPAPPLTTTLLSVVVTTKPAATAVTPRVVAAVAALSGSDGGGDGGSDGGSDGDIGVGPDGLSERPPGAILLLLLGVAMTVVAGVASTWRARGRPRRAGRRLAHDADYLVNGMYL